MPAAGGWHQGAKLAFLICASLTYKHAQWTTKMIKHTLCPLQCTYRTLASVPNTFSHTFWMHSAIVMFACAELGEAVVSTSTLAHNGVSPQLIYLPTKRCSLIETAGLLSHLLPCFLLQWVFATISHTKWRGSSGDGCSFITHYHLHWALCDLRQHVEPYRVLRSTVFQYNFGILL